MGQVLARTLLISLVLDRVLRLRQHGLCGVVRATDQSDQQSLRGYGLDMNGQQAKVLIKDIKGFYRHLATFAAVNLALFAMNIMAGDELWFFYPMFGWGIGLALHAFKTFAAGKGWEERKLQELTGWSATQEELEQLRERTEVLIAVLSSVDWERIDPSLLSSRENVECAPDY